MVKYIKREGIFLMQPNSPLQPLQPMQPKVPGVPQVPDVPKVPDVPQIPETPNNTPTTAQSTQPEQKTAETPKITGVSMPAGSNKKPESPEQRSNKINAANAPKPEAQEKKQNLLHKPVTMEEVEEYRRNSTKKKKTILISVLIILAVTGITTAVILLKTNQQNYQELSSLYNDNLPIVVRSSEGNDILISQSGKKLSEKYNNIDDFESDRSLAYIEEEGKTTSVIIDNNGNEKYSTEKTLTKINQGENYLVNEDGKTFLLDKNGKKVDERPLASVQYGEEQKYLLVADDNSYAVITNEGQVKISGTVDKTSYRSFSYGHSDVDDNNYCAFVKTTRKDSKLYVYNCETASEIANIENVYFTGEFVTINTSFLVSEVGSSYFYNNEMIYNSDTSDTEAIGGIIKKENEERYFNPVTRKYTESFPTESLIKQDKFNNKTSYSEECSIYEKRPTSNLTHICKNIYYDNKLISASTDKFDYYLPNKNLDDFLAYNKKHYIFKQNKSSGNISVVNAETGNDEYSNVTIQANTETPAASKSRFISQNEGSTKKITDLATGKSASYENNPSVRLEANYYVIAESTDTGYIARYFNADHKEIYKEER